jgi:GH43 family beta-xylosidase
MRVCILIFSLTCLVSAQTNLFINPVLSEKQVGRWIYDPGVMRDGDVYYLYHIGEPKTEIWGYTSTDLVHWDGPTVVYSWDREDDPSVFGMSAAQPFKYNGIYYLYFNSRSGRAGDPAQDQRKIRVVKSSDPLHFTGGSVWLDPAPEDGEIDAYPIEIDGDLFLFYRSWHSGWRGVEVNAMSSPTALKGDETKVCIPTEAWEEDLAEAPAVFVKDDKIYVLYSGGLNDGQGRGYQTGYCETRRSTPMGPYRKMSIGQCLIGESDEQNVYGPGSGAMVQDGAGDWWFVHHQAVSADRLNSKEACLTRLYFKSNGDIDPDKTRASWGQPLPAPVSLQ